MEMSNQMLMRSRLESRLNIDIIGPLVSGVPEVGFTLIFEVIKRKFEHVVINAAGNSYLIGQITGHMPESISVGHGAANQDDFIVGQEICVAKRQETIPVAAVKADHCDAVVRRRMGEFPPEQLVYVKRPVIYGGDQQLFERAG
jgi:hypothetical protein